LPSPAHADDRVGVNILECCDEAAGVVPKKLRRG